jgi:CubicO group peptidase (beta-lactamase class C family)
MNKGSGFLVRACLTAVMAGAWPGAWAGAGFPGKNWEQAASVEDAGWSAAGLAAADSYARTLQTDAYLIVDHGLIVHRYGDCARPINLHSMRKSVLSVLMGIYADRGQVDIDKSLADLDINEKVPLTKTERQATVRQLLQARSGVYLPAAYEAPEAKAARPARGSFLPGQHWYYNNWDFNALGTIFQKFTGKSVFEALRDDLARPLQFEDFNLSRDTQFWLEPESVHPAYIMRLSARDFARVGLLMSRKGDWDGQRIVPESWVAESTRSYSGTDQPKEGYGYLWWVSLDRPAYSANGYDGQIMIVNPARDVVIVHLVDTDDGSRRRVTHTQLSALLDRIFEARLPPRKPGSASPAPPRSAPARP